MLRRFFHSVKPYIAAIVLMVCLASLAEACPTCKDTLSQNDTKGKAIVSGYFYSILFMMGMPFAILGTVGGVFFWKLRKADAQPTRMPESSSPESSLPEDSEDPS